MRAAWGCRKTKALCWQVTLMHTLSMSYKLQFSWEIHPECDCCLSSFGINAEKNIFFSSHGYLTIQNQVGAWSGCHDLHWRKAKNANQKHHHPMGPLTPQLLAVGILWHRPTGEREVRGCGGGGTGQNLEKGTVQDLTRSSKQVLANSFQYPIHFNFNEVGKNPSWSFYHSLCQF